MPDVRPVIGDFRTSPNDAPRKTEPVEEPVAKVPPEPDIRSTESVVAKAVGEMKATAAAAAELTPVERYHARLKEAGVSIEKATQIYDAVLTSGYYEEYVRIGKNARAVFRTRAYEDSLRLQTAIEMLRPQLAITQDELVTRYNLAATLFEWQGKAIPHNNDDDFEAALKMVRKLPGPVYSLLAGKLVEFDMKVMAIFSDGAPENFS